jgi:hypothetical protein
MQLLVAHTMIGAVETALEISDMTFHGIRRNADSPFVAGMFLRYVIHLGMLSFSAGGHERRRCVCH